MPGSFSNTMRLKHDPNQSMLQVLKKYKLEDILRDVVSWLESEPAGPGSLKKYFISTFRGRENPKGGEPLMVNFYDIDLKDPTTWGDDDPEFPIPSDQFFIDLFKAIKADDKRNSKRSSYEF